MAGFFRNTVYNFMIQAFALLDMVVVLIFNWRHSGPPDPDPASDVVVVADPYRPPVCPPGSPQYAYPQDPYAYPYGAPAAYPALPPAYGAQPPGAPQPYSSVPPVYVRTDEPV
jgi:hypothetical protein